MNKISILIVDPNRDHVEILNRFLMKENQELRIDSIKNINELQPAIMKNSYDIIVSEFIVGEYNGNDLLNQIKELNIDIPVVFFTQESREDIVVEAFRNGAKDFYVKDFSISNLRKLKNSIKGVVSEIRAVREQSRMQKLLEENYIQMKNIFNTLEEKIFITDKDYNILFYNKEDFNRGEKCYKAVFKNEDVCSFCVAEELFKQNVTHISIKREIYEPKSGSWYECVNKLITWTNGEKVQLAILIDITDLKNKNEILNNRLKYEKAISEISSKAMMIKDLDDFLNTSLKILGKTTGVSRVYIFKNYDNNRRSLNTHEWTKEGIESFIGLDADFNDFPYWFSTLANGGIIKASDIHDLPSEVHEILEMQDIISILVVPIFVKTNFIGFIGFDECTKKRVWEEYEINILRATAQIIGARISYEH